MGYYVKIDKPREFRRDVLESSKKLITCLHAYRNVLVLRQKKRELFLTLQQDIKELSLLISKLDKMLPEKQLRQEAMRQLKAKERAKKKAEEAKNMTSAKKKGSTTKKKGAVKKKSNTAKKTEEKKKAPEPKKPLTEIDRLNHTLADIESKLANL